jgi:hypothetical protein
LLRSTWNYRAGCRPAAASCLALILLGAAPARLLAQSGQPSFASRVLKAARLPMSVPPPAINGDLSDAAWKLAARADNFVDPSSGRAFLDQTEAFLLYDSQFIYVGFHCKDSSPAALVARETVRDSAMPSEDTIQLTLDPYLTRRYEDYSVFTVNAIGTRATQMGGGRAGKTEWQGDWTAAARRVADGWTAELRIPWTILNYPNRKGPGRMGINFRRQHSRTKIESMWSDLGPQRFNEQDGSWDGVEAPQRAWKPRLSLLPYLQPIGAAAGKLGEIRSGLDLRYQPTSDATIVGTIHPDFASVEGAVESIAFSRSERFVPERRPFFLEGQGYLGLGEDYQVGRFFDSQHIHDVDAGIKAYGKLGAANSFGILGTAALSGESNYVTQFRHDFGATAAAYGMLLQHIKAGEDNSVLILAQNARRGKWGVDSQFAASGGPQAGGKAASAALNLSDKNLFSTVRWTSVGTKFTDRLGLIGFNDYHGISSFTDWSATWLHGPIRSFDASFNPVWNWHQDGRPFQRTGNLGFTFDTRSDYRISTGLEVGKFDDERDFTFTLGIEGSVSNRFHRWGIGITTGTQASLPYTAVGPSFSVRVRRKLDLVFASVIQNYKGVQHQEILTFNYEITPNRAWGGRAVVNNGDVNFYLSYRNAGRAGTDTYFVIGDPNARRFSKQVLVKWVFAL